MYIVSLRILNFDKVVTKNLLEMNPDVMGEAISESAENFIKNRAVELSKFNFIISCEQSLVKIKLCVY